MNEIHKAADNRKLKDKINPGDSTSVSDRTQGRETDNRGKAHGVPDLKGPLSGQDKEEKNPSKRRSILKP